MRRLATALAGAILGLGVFVPAVLAADPMPQTGRVVISTQGDVTIPAGDQADAVIVVRGHAEIRGAVTTLVVVDGSATLTAAELDTVVVVGSTVEVADGTTVHDKIQRLDSTVHQSGNVAIEGGVTDLGATFLEIGAFLAPALILIWFGFGLATIAWALLFAALAARQIREAQRLISQEPGQTIVVGVLGIIAIPVVAIALLVTIIGAPLGLGILFMALPLLAFVGYLVAATWLGSWILGRLSASTERERPYLPAVVGVLVLSALQMVPVLGILTAILSLFGFGAVLVLGFRTLRGAPRAAASVQRPVAAPTGA